MALLPRQVAGTVMYGKLGRYAKSIITFLFIALSSRIWQLMILEITIYSYGHFFYILFHITI